MKFKRVLILFICLIVILGSIPTARAQSSDSYVKLSAFYESVVAMDPEGRVWMWGYGAGFAPFPVLLPDPVVDVVAGRQYGNYALTESGQVWTWGGEHGLIPVPMSDLNGIVSLAVGRTHMVALKADGTVWSWGDNSRGQLGDGTNLFSEVPIQVNNLSGVIAVAAGHQFTIAVKNDGTVWSWGSNESGSLGNATSYSSPVPAMVEGLDGVNIVSISTGKRHTMALSDTGAVYVWGSSRYMQLGDGTYEDRYAAGRVEGLGVVTSIATGESHSLAVSGGEVFAWGLNDSSQAGRSSSERVIGVPVKVAGLNNINSVHAGNDFSVAVDENGFAYSWGSNYRGELGALLDRYTVTWQPVQVTNSFELDELLGNLIAAALDKPGENITREDIAQIEVISVPGMDLETLAGLQFASNLKYLDIADTGLYPEYNFHLFPYIRQLQYLDASFMEIRDPSYISMLSQLENLYLMDTSVTSLDFVESLTALQSLDVSFNNIRDLTPLGDLTNLRYLSLWDNDVYNIGTLSALRQLEYLDIEENNISDLSPLLDLSNLREVYMRGLRNFYAGPGTANRAVIRALKVQGAQVVHDPVYVNINRIKGANRYATAAAISQEGWPASDTVILARGDNFADALSGVPLAHHLKAPILLTPSAYLAESTQEELKRLGATRVIVLGGTGAVSAGITTELEKMGIAVERIAGSNRYDTAAKIAEEMRVAGAQFDTAVIAYGMDFPDALAAAPYAAQMGYPVLLTDSSALPDSTVQALAELGIQETLVIGGNAVIEDSLLPFLPSPTRIKGINRYATAAALADFFAGHIATDSFYVATGTEFADAITGAVLAAKHGNGMLLMPKHFPEAVSEILSHYLPDSLTIFGGTGAVDAEMEELLNWIQ